MFRFLLGVVVGAVGTALYLDRQRVFSAGIEGGRVDELSSAADHVVADPELNPGDGTPSRAGEVGA